MAAQSAAEKRLEESDPVYAASRPSQTELQRMAEADAMLEQAREAVNVAASHRLQVSRHADELERRAGMASAGGLPSMFGSSDSQQEAKRAVRDAERALEDAQEAAGRVQRRWREVADQISAARSGRRRKAQSEWQEKYAPKRTESRMSPMAEQFAPSHGKEVT